MVPEHRNEGLTGGPTIAVVIPCYNEERTVGQVVSSFKKALPESEIYVIDNNSTDSTLERAQTAGAKVIRESRQGKGNVVRRIIRCIEADVYVMVDGDLTYPPEFVHALVAPVLNDQADMVVGDRISNSSYDSSNTRRFHSFGNALVCVLVNRLFRTNLRDIMSGYRAMSRSFLKCLPVLSEGFEIETAMTLHALDKRFKIIEIPVDYRNRPNGSVSKLNTYADGLLVLKTIASLFKNYKPLQFFSGLSCLAFIAGLGIGIPPILEFLEMHLVYKIPSAILAASLMILSMLFFCCGLMLDTVVRHQRENYELMMTRDLTPRQAKVAGDVATRAYGMSEPSRGSETARPVSLARTR
jgi:glycosyltransferase involved in cell wall biosynthesis